MAKPKPPREHNYERKIKYLAKLGAIPTGPGAASHVSVFHDDWCGVFQERRCDCDPAVKARWTLPPAAAN